MDVDGYRKRYEAALEKASVANRQRSASLREARVATSAAERIDAIAAVTSDREELAPGVAELMQTLKNRTESVQVRLAALQTLGALDFLGPRFAPFRADYKEALREIATDPRVALRERALERLAVDKDPYAQELLVRGLENPKEARVSDARALQLLAYDDHAELIPLAQRVFRTKTGAAREEALRVLSTDPGSQRLLARLLTDKAEKSPIRRLSASGLQQLNPAAFERAARKIIADESDYNEIRATALASLAHGREPGQEAAAPDFIASVEALAKNTRSRLLRSSSRRFLRSSRR